MIGKDTPLDDLLRELEIYLECGAFIELAFNINFSAKGDNLCFYQEETKSFAFHMGVEPFIEGKHVLFILPQINTQAVVGNREANKVLH